MKRKWSFLLLTIVSLLFSVGWGKVNVQLLNNKKLIDLDAAIARCIPGAESSKREPDSEKSGEEKERNITIRIRNRTVMYDGLEYINMAELEKQIQKDCGEHVTFCLQDDFAEAHVYRQLLSMLSKLESEIGLRYTKE